MQNEATRLMRLGMLVIAFFLFLIALGGPFESPVKLEPVMDTFVPDYLDHQENSQMPWWLYPIAMIPFVGLAVLALMVVLFTYSALTKRGWNFLGHVLGVFNVSMGVFNRWITLPYGRMFDRLLVSLMLTALIMGVMSAIGVSYESTEQKAALFLASLLTVTAIFQNRLILLRRLEE